MSQHRIHANVSSSPRSKKTSARECNPLLVALPPSPPPTDSLEDLDPVRPKSSRRGPNRARFNLSNEPLPQSKAASPPRFSGPHPLSNSRKRTRDPFEAASPPSSPTNRKSIAENTKRLRSSSGGTPSGRPLPSSALDSPRNPFVAKPGEKTRRAGVKRQDGRSKLVYVFRGKRVLYDSTEDLDGPSGDSPFSMSKPKLLFPSPPSPSLGSGPERSGIAGPSSPHRTPTKKSNPATQQFLHTPQSRPRNARQKVLKRVLQPQSSAVSKTTCKSIR